MPVYGREKITDRFHDACSLRTDYPFIIKCKMKGIQKKSKRKWNISVVEKTDNPQRIICLSSLSLNFTDWIFFNPFLEAYLGHLSSFGGKGQYSFATFSSWYQYATLDTSSCRSNKPLWDIPICWTVTLMSSWK